MSLKNHGGSDAEIEREIRRVAEAQRRESRGTLLIDRGSMAGKPKGGVSHDGRVGGQKPRGAESNE